MLYEHAHDQAEKLRKRLFFVDNIKAGVLIKEQKLITILSDSSFEVARHFDCLDANAKIFYHKSHDAIFAEHNSIFFSRAVHPEVRRRVNVAHTIGMESGLISYHTTSRAPKIVSVFPSGFVPSTSCVHSAHHERTHSHHQVSYRYSRKFLRLIFSCYCACVVVLLIEIMYSNYVSHLARKASLEKRLIRRKDNLDGHLTWDAHQRIMRRAKEVDRVIKMYYI